MGPSFIRFRFRFVIRPTIGSDITPAERGGGGEVLRILSDGDDRMGQNSKPPKVLRASNKNPQ